MKFFILLTISLIMTSSSFHNRECVKGEIEYSAATYSDELFLKEKYRQLFDSLLQEPVFDCFCNKKIKNLPRKVKYTKASHKPFESSIIEPVYVDLSNFNGLYTRRIYTLGPKARNPRFRSGYYHYTFILSDYKFIPLSEDTIKNEKLIGQHLSSTFSKEEILRMKEAYKYSVICNHFTHHPPLLIKKGDSILFDAFKLDDESSHDD